MIFTYIKAAKFFPKYCPQVKNWKHKLREIDGNGKEIFFSKEDKKAIKAGLKKMCKDLSRLFIY